jgi:hypothetical protein
VTPDAYSGGIEGAAGNRVIAVSVTAVSWIAVAGPIAVAIGRSVSVRGVAVTSPITIAVSRVAISVAISRVTVAVTTVV